MDGRLTRTNCDEAGDYVVPNRLCPRDLVSRPDNIDETVLSSLDIFFWKNSVLDFFFRKIPPYITETYPY